jgi:hypothetical protein
MTAKATVEIIKESSLWDTLSIKERIEAIEYAIGAADADIEKGNVCDLIVEVYAG